MTWKNIFTSVSNLFLPSHCYVRVSVITYCKLLVLFLYHKTAQQLPKQFSWNSLCQCVGSLGKSSIWYHLFRYSLFIIGIYLPHLTPSTILTWHLSVFHDLMLAKVAENLCTAIKGLSRNSPRQTPLITPTRQQEVRIPFTDMIFWVSFSVS